MRSLSTLSINVRSFLKLLTGKQFLLIFVGFAVFASCNKESGQISQRALRTMSVTIADSNFVELSTATEVAKRINDSVFMNNAENTTHRGITSYYEIPDKNGKTALYVFNYENEKGFVVLSADFRYEPICAYVRQGNLLLSDTIPGMVDSWFGRTVENIDAVRGGAKESLPDIAPSYRSWALLMGIIHVEQYHPKFPPVNCDPAFFAIKGPLMSTLWGQGCGYNELCPTCNSNCGHKVTGCVATAMAQVIKYWQYPVTGHNYSAMANNSGNSDVAKLMWFAGLSVSMNYGCDASGANDAIVRHGFETTFGFSSGGTFEDYNVSDRWIIKSDIDANRPVLLSASRNQSRFLWMTWETDGHEWVCDGYRVSGDQCYKHFWFCMNWGWDGRGNGWYYQTDWVPVVNGTTYNYQYGKNILHNIHP